MYHDIWKTKEKVCINVNIIIFIIIVVIVCLFNNEKELNRIIENYCWASKAS